MFPTVCLLSLYVVLLAVPSLQQPPGVPPHQPPGHQQAGGQQERVVVTPQPDQVHHGFGQKEVHDMDHIKEHLKEVVDKPKEEMTEEELEFHYFKLHDYDNNNKLDGTEVTKAITHFHAEDGDKHKEEEEEGGGEGHHEEKGKVFSDDEISNIVDMVLREDDANDDGYIEYMEFVMAQRKARDEPPADQKPQH